MNAALSAFFEGQASGEACFRAFEGALKARYLHMEMKVQKTQISFYDGGMFCCVSLPRRKGEQGMIVTFGLDALLPDARIAQAVEPYPNRWTHHVHVSSPNEIDDQLLAWIDWAHSFKVRTRRKKACHENNCTD